MVGLASYVLLSGNRGEHHEQVVVLSKRDRAPKHKQVAI